MENIPTIQSMCTLEQGPSRFVGNLESGHICNWHIVLANEQIRDVLYFNEYDTNNGLWAQIEEVNEPFEIRQFSQSQCILERIKNEQAHTITFHFNDLSLHAKLEVENRSSDIFYWTPRWNFKLAVPWLEETSQKHYNAIVPAKKCFRDNLKIPTEELYPLNTLRHRFSHFKHHHFQIRSLNEEDSLSVYWPQTQPSILSLSAQPQHLFCSLYPPGDKGIQVAPCARENFSLDITL